MSGVEDEPEEVKWTDASIRWTEEELGGNRKKDDGKQPEEDQHWDPFADPTPVETLNFKLDGIRLQIEAYKENTDQAWESTGLTLWKATHVMNDYLLSHHEEYIGKHSLELGAGLGVCGFLLHHLLEQVAVSKDEQVTSNDQNEPSTQLFLTDGDTEALELLRKNATRNQVIPFAGSMKSSSVHTSIRQLLWGRETAKALRKQLQRQSTTTMSSFSFIFASDIVYAPQVLEPLWETVDELLAKEDGKFVLAFAKRQVPVQLDDVLRTSREAGFATTTDSFEPNEDGVFLLEFIRQRA